MRGLRGRRSGRSTSKAVDDAVALRDRPVDAPVETPFERTAEGPVEPPTAALVQALTEAPPKPPVEVPGAMPVVASQLEMQSEVLRLLEVVTSMCDHVIEYIESDRAERRLMMEALAHLGRVITDGTAAAVGAAAAAPATPAAPIDVPTERAAEPFAARERVIGGSMPAGPAPIIDLCGPESVLESVPEPAPVDALELSTTTDIAVEVRGRFGDRWVDGFEICEVMTTPAGPRYRLRRHRDGVVLPELFDATSIRHVETFDELNDDQLNDATTYWSRS